ncbi:MAG TPA: hypothetical protein VFG69_16645, partial [Nannocystaceae bacterium]|nr:hypothetical protein [Nannocystaceae bacterium]
MCSRSLSLAVLALAGACVRIGAYECADADACSARPGGRCESTRYCSYPDGECESGARYSSHAGPLANECTEPIAGSSSGSSSTSTTDAASTTSSSSSSSDEGSTTNGPQPGTVLWSFTHDGGDGDDAFQAVAALSDGGFIVGGYQATAGQGHDAFVARYTGPDADEWIVVRDYGGGLDNIDDLLFSPGGSVFVTGEHEPVSGTYQSWTGCFRAEDGGECWMEPTIGYTGRGIAYGVDSLVVVAGANTPLADGFVSVRYAWGQLAWEYVVDDADPLAALTVGSVKYVAGAHTDKLWLGSVDEAGVTDLAIVDGPAAGPDAIQQLGTDGETIVAVGYVATQTSRDGWIGAFALDGGLLWQRSEGAVDLDEELESVVVDDAGIVYAVGYATDIDKDTWIATWTIDGEPGWARADFEIGDGDDIARDVVGSGDAILMVGEARGA